MRRYNRLWKLFLKTGVEEFEARGLTIKDIKRIGINKFVRMNGWETPEDVSKWKTDVYEVIPCPECGKDFGILDDTLGLCDSCRGNFDLRRFYTDLNDACSKHPEEAMGLSGQAIALFLADAKVRDHYKKEIIAKVEDKSTFDRFFKR